SPQYPESHGGGDPSVAEARPPRAPPARTAVELATRLEALERALDELAAADAPENLLNAVGHYADEHRWGGAAQVLSRDGSAAVGGAGVFAGRERVRAAFETAFGRRREGEFELHQTAQPVIHASAATGTTMIRTRLALIGAKRDGDGVYAAGVYEAAVRAEEEGWRIGALDFYPTWAASHSRGWARVSAGESAALMSVPAAGLAEADRPV